MTETVTHNAADFTIVSNTQNAEQLEQSFKPAEEPKKAEPEPAPAPEPSDDNPEPVAAEPAEKPLGKPKNDPRARVEQATRQLAETKRQRDEIERRAVAAEMELEKLRAGMPKEAKPAEPEKSKEVPGKPKADDFETYDDYVEALTDWKAEQRETSAKEAAQKAEAEQRRDAMIQHQVTMFNAFQERIDQAIKADPEIDTKISADVVALVPQGPVDLTKKLSNDDLIGVHFISEEKGLDMMRHLSENPDVLQRLRGLSQGKLLIELGRIDARLESVTTAPDPKPTISRANPPVRPVTAVAPSGSDEPDPSEPFDVWAKKRERQLERERKAQHR